MESEFPELLCMEDVCKQAALSPSYVYDLRARQLFPLALQLGARARATLAADVNLWLAVCLELRAQMSTLNHPVELPVWPPAQDVVVPCQRIQMLYRWEVLALLNRSYSHLYRLMELDDPDLRFPWPAPVGVKARRWPQHEVLDWLMRRRSTRARRLRAANPWICARPGSGSDERP